MKKYKIQQVSSLALGNQKAIFLSAFLFLIGISAGVFLELSMDSADKMHAAQFLNQYLYVNDASGIDYGNPFFSSTGANLFLLILMMLSGLSTIGFPAAYLIIIYKGMALGFSAGLILENFAISGIATILVSMVPQNLLLIPAFILAASAAQNYGLSGLSHRDKRYKKNGRPDAVGLDRYLAVYLILAVLVLAACLLEAFIFPFLRA